MTRARALALGLALCACASDAPPAPDGPPPGVAAQAVVGGTEAPEAVAVVALVARRVRCGDDAPPALLCSGVLVARDAVLTAAHCLDVFGPRGPYEVFSGPALGGPGRWARVASAHAHPGYVPATHAYDVALLRLATPLDLPPLPLATHAPPAAGAQVRALGFGDTRDPAAPAGVRREGLLEVTAVEAAAFRAGPAPAMSCVGDSGGPVLTEAGDAVLGVTVSGDFACRAEAVMVRADAVMDFVTPLLAAAPPAAPALPPEALCRAACSTDADCPAGLLCEPLEDGARRCLVPALQAGGFGAACTTDTVCGPAGLCARLESEGEGACRCFQACADAAPPALPERGCTAAPGPGVGLTLLLLALGGRRRRNGGGPRA